VVVEQVSFDLGAAYFYQQNFEKAHESFKLCMSVIDKVGLLFHILFVLSLVSGQVGGGGRGADNQSSEAFSTVQPSRRV